AHQPRNPAQHEALRGGPWPAARHHQPRRVDLLRQASGRARGLRRVPREFRCARARPARQGRRMNEPIFSRRLLIGWVGAAIATFAVSLYFMGRQGEPGADAVGPSSYSRSAIGHAGIAEVLQRLGMPVVKSRNNSADKLGNNGLLVLAEPRPTAVGDPALRALLEARAVLLVLPKWAGKASEKKPGWLGVVQEKSPAESQWALNLVDEDGEGGRQWGGGARTPDGHRGDQCARTQPTARRPGTAHALGSDARDHRRSIGHAAGRA